MRVPAFVIYAVMVVLGALAISPIFFLMDVDAMPGDITINQQNLHFHISVFYSLATSVSLALLFWWWRR
jgi:hypothetical protein